MTNPTSTDVHVDAALTDISIGFLQDANHFIADKVFPTVPVAHQSDKYYVYQRDDFWRDDMKVRAPATESAGGGYDLSTDSYTADVWSYHKDVDDQTRANADPAIDPEQDATEFVTQKALIRREREWATTHFTTGVWATDVVGGTDFTVWSDPASDPEKDVQDGTETILQNTGFMPNTMVVSFSVHQALKRHPLIKDRFKYTSAESITEAMIARFFEIDRYLVAKGVYVSSKEDASSDTYAFALGSNALLCYSNPTPRLMMPSAGYNFVWSGLTGLNNMGTRISRIPVDLRRAVRVEIDTAFALKKVSADLGYFFSGAAT
jgi:hypothetical protein